MRKICKLLGVTLLILALLVLQLPMPEADAATSTSGFSISKGVLTAYTGTESNVVIPDSVETIATDAFKNNTYITSVTLGKKVTCIEPYAFWNCYKLQNVYFNSELTGIDDFAFSNCSGLTSVNLPSNIETIGIYAFEDCVNLSDINIPYQTRYIHETAFDGCFKLVIHAPSGSYADDYARGFYNRQKEFPEYQDVVDYNTSDTDNGNGNISVEQLPENAILGTGTNSDGTGTGVSIYGDSADKTLSSVHVVANGALMFMDITSPKVYYGNDVNGTETPTFEIDKVDNGDSITTPEGISPQEFSDKYQGKIPKFTIVDGKIIADQAYYKNKTINNIEIPNGIEEIGQFSYARSKASSLSVPEGVKKIGYGAFYHCDNLQQVSLPETIEIVEPYAFEHTGWVKNFMAQSPMGNDSDFLVAGGVVVAYKGNSNEVHIPEGVRVIGAEVFKNHDEIEYVSIARTVTDIGEGAFEGCIRLGKINFLGNAVKTIRDRAFYNTALMSIELPASVEAAGLQAFRLDTTVTSLANVKPLTTHELTAERLSNYEYRGTGNGNVVDGAVIVYGLTGAEAMLEGADRPYALTFTYTPNSAQIDSAIDRVADYESSLKGINVKLCYQLALTDNSGIPITKLGKQGLTVAIPIPNELEGLKVRILTVDRNGQLEEIPVSVVDTQEESFIRFTTYHLSPFALCSTGEQIEENEVAIESYAIAALAGPPISDAVQQGGNSWFANGGWKIIVAGVLFIAGLILLLFVPFRKNNN